MKDLARRFVGWPTDNIEDIWQHGYRARFYRGGEVLMSAMSGLDIALVSPSALSRFSTWRRRTRARSLTHPPPSVLCSRNQWDIKGKRMGVPVWSLLGGAVRNKIPVYVRAPRPASSSSSSSSALGPRSGRTRTDFDSVVRRRCDSSSAGSVVTDLMTSCPRPRSGRTQASRPSRSALAQPRPTLPPRFKLTPWFRCSS